jgi:hypothetical protein
MDLDPRYFTKIVEYLCLLKTWNMNDKNEDRNKDKSLALPKMTNCDEQKVMDLYIDFFCLRQNKDGHPNVTSAGTSTAALSVDQNKVPTYDALLNTFKKEQQAPTLVKKNLDDMEEKFVAEEGIVSLFIE